MKLFKTSKLIFLGYALLATFIIVSIGLLKNNDEQIQKNYQTLILSQNQAQAILSMQIHGKSRLQSLSLILFEDDPFKQDEYIQNFLVAGNQFGIILDSFLAQKNQSQYHTIFEDIRKQVFFNADKQNRVIELVLDERHLEAIKAYQLTIPLQNKTMDDLSALIKRSTQAAKDAKNEYNSVIEYDENLSRTLNLVLLISTFSFGLYSFRQSKKHETLKEQQIESLSDEIGSQVLVNEMDSHILHAVDEFIALLDKNGRIVRANPKFISLYNHANVSLDMPAWKLLETISHTDINKPELLSTLKNHHWRQELTLIKNTALDMNYALCQIQKFNSAGVPLAQYLLTLQDITQLRQVQNALEKQANYDTVTDLPNRRYFQEKLYSLLNSKPSTIALLFIDIDDFKNVNDSLGHHFGDSLLKQVSQRMNDIIQQSTSSVYTLSRVGGDEFSVIVEFEHEQQKNHCNELMQAFMVKLREPYIIQDQNLNINCSIGVAYYPEHGSIPSELMRNADLAMYHAKHLGKNQFAIFNENLAQQLQLNINLKEQLINVIENQELTFHYQPQYHLETYEVTGLEALIRWGDEKPVYRPDQFINFAEENGLIHLIDDYVIEKVMQQIHLWRKQGINVPKVALNISSQLINSDDLIAKLEKHQAEFNIESQTLELEITEYSIVENLQAQRDQESMLTKLSELGIKLAIDDFGTGYSSLSYLQFMKVSLLKIDRSFIKNMTQSKENQAIVASIISLAHNINASVLAEGIETEEQYQQLKRLGCDQGQGYLMSKPLNVEKTTALLKQNEQTC